MSLNRAVAPQIAELIPFSITRAKTIKLTNGIKLHYIKSGAQPLVKLEIIFHAGNYQETQRGISFFTAKMLKEGTKTMTNKEIANKIAFYGANLEFIAGLDKITVSAIVLIKHFNAILPILVEIIEESVFSEKNLEAIKNIYLQQFMISKEKTSYVATGLFKQTIFGASHPYGYFISEDDINRIQTKDCISYYNSFIKNCNFEIIASGMITDDILTQIDKFFGVKSNKISAQNGTLIRPRPENKLNLTETKTNAVQSSLRIGKRLFTRNHPDFLKITVLNEVLGGYFGSRLMKIIREEKGLTYSIYSQVVTHINDGYFVICSDVKKELLSDAITEIYFQLELLKNEKIGNEELKTVKNYMIGSFFNSINTPFALSDKFKTLYFNGLNYDYYDNYIANINKITATNLQSLANKYFDTSGFAQVVVG